MAFRFVLSIHVAAECDSLCFCGFSYAGNKCYGLSFSRDIPLHPKNPPDGRPDGYKDNIKKDIGRPDGYKDNIKKDIGR